MGVYIPGMEMPKSCEKCPFCIVNRHDRGDDSLCRLINKEVFTFMRSLPQDCPLVPVPPHGRLIDKDALLEDIDSNMIVTPSKDGSLVEVYGAEKILAHIAYAPTVIEAEDHIGDANEMVGDSE